MRIRYLCSSFPRCRKKCHNYMSLMSLFLFVLKKYFVWISVAKTFLSLILKASFPIFLGPHLQLSIYVPGENSHMTSDSRVGKYVRTA